MRKEIEENERAKQEEVQRKIEQRRKEVEEEKARELERQQEEKERAEREAYETDLIMRQIREYFDGMSVKREVVNTIIDMIETMPLILKQNFVDFLHVLTHSKIVERNQKERDAMKETFRDLLQTVGFASRLNVDGAAAFLGLLQNRITIKDKKVIAPNKTVDSTQFDDLSLIHI